MFDTMTLTKIVGGFCGALLIFLLGGWAAESLYHTGGGHGDGDHAAQGYMIATDDAGQEEVAEEVVPFADLLAAADLGKGAKVFSKCKACHKLDGSNATGPYLDGIVDRAVSSVDGFGYSGALVAVADVWDADALNGFLEDPKGFAPGTKMSFSGLAKPQDRANLIAYLASLGG